MISPTGLPTALASLDRTLVMGILNVTPDSFSDGGRWAHADAAVDHAIRLHADGADLVDVGGESTRPGAVRISADEELSRVGPVVIELSRRGIPVSIDTMRADVAAECVAAGACLVNDVSGGMADPEMLPWLATTTVPYVAMHWRGPSAVMDDLAVYDDVVADVTDELGARLATLAAAGVDPGRVIVDPGLGFAKRAEHNWALLRSMDVLAQLGRPLLIGASRKRFLGELLAEPDGTVRPMDRREAAGDAVATLAAFAGAWGVRVHEVAAIKDAAMVARVWRGRS
ncbi:MAG: dihydropteroate synthase [Candidatus Nanopelagicales bacterium]|nr:dihydropteroate synthase [Candidatus Nanopelagicales bacterium]